MNYLKTTLFLFVALLIVSCAKTFAIYISTTQALDKYGDELKEQSFLIYPELRENPIKWFDSIPEGKIEAALRSSLFKMAAQPGEFYVYQVGVWALCSDLHDVRVEFSDLKKGGYPGEMIPAQNMTCFNEGGINFKGKKFTKTIDVKAGRIQSLWMGIDLSDKDKGTYSGSVTVSVGAEKHIIPLQLIVSGEVVHNHGYNQGKRLSRLSWLNSNVGIDDQITKGYLPVKVEGNNISILGRTMSIEKNGLPASIISFFSPSNQKMNEKGEPIVNQPFRFIIEKDDGNIVQLKPEPLTFTCQTSSNIAWNVLNTSEECDLQCSGNMEYDGFIDYKLKLTAKKPLKVKDIRMEIPMVKEKSQYMMGLGKEGGLRPESWHWKWDVSKNQDMLWVGAVNGGIRIKWKAENYVRPLVNIYYEFGPLHLPPSWENGGKGGIVVTQKNNEVVINAYSGSRVMNAGEALNYDFEMLITPFHLINRQNKFGDRYYHGGGTNTSAKVEKAKKAGANIINIHHAEDIYPFINYPYLDENIMALKNLVDRAHEENMRLKVYYTTRELTINIPEFWAFYSLNGEIIFPGPGNATRTEALHPKGPNEWYIKNLKENYIPAWYNVINEGKFKGKIDLSVITTPDSRLNNFYVAGLDWMVQNIGIDGVYIDDSALDNFTLRRARKIIDLYRPEGRMDLHSWDHFNAWAGYASCLNLYMDLLPYFDLVWIGEGRNYDRMPDYWLIEVSGIPFGVTGQMLEGGGNPWRGMVYGITNRAGYADPGPENLWKFFDEYHIDQKEMIGYWDERCPVKCNNELVKVSVYKDAEESVISLANWSENDLLVELNVDWQKLGFAPSSVEIFIPEIKDFQEEKLKILLDTLTIPGRKGFLVVVRKKNYK